MKRCLFFFLGLLAAIILAVLTETGNSRGEQPLAANEVHPAEWQSGNLAATEDTKGEELGETVLPKSENSP